MFRLFSSIADDRVTISSGYQQKTFHTSSEMKSFCVDSSLVFLVVCVSIKLEIDIANKSIV